MEADLAILDVVLPQVNGIDLAIVIHRNYPRCKFLLISGHPTTIGFAEQAAAKGGHSFEIHPKPLHPAHILAQASSILSRNEETND